MTSNAIRAKKNATMARVHESKAWNAAQMNADKVEGENGNGKMENWRVVWLRWELGLRAG